MSSKSDVSSGPAYRIGRPTLPVMLTDMRISPADLGPGDLAPDFDLPTTDGGRFDRNSLAIDGRPVLLVFGSLTCPVTESAGPALKTLHQRYGDAVRFVAVNVREAHPGSATGQPETAEGKLQHASALRRHHGFEFETAVDDVEGTLHRAFGTRPSSAYLLDPDGRIMFRAHWSNVAEALDEALAAVVAGRLPPRTTAGGTLRSMLRMTGHADVAFRSAGRGALRDTWRVMPPLAAVIVASRAFGFLPRDRRGLPALALLVALVGVVVGAVAALF